MTKRKIWLSAVIVLFSCVCLLVGLFSINRASAQEFVYVGTLQATYNIGDEIIIPEAQVGEVKADCVVTYPDGSATSKKSFIAETSGAYTVDYFAVVDGETLKSTKYFSVHGTMFSVIGEGGVEYVEPRADRAGIAATIKKDSYLVYNDVIDLMQFDWNKPFIKLAALPKTPGEAEADVLKITLTDVYDENIYVDINVKRYLMGGANNYSVSYMDASFNGGVAMGMYKSNNGKYKVYMDRYENTPDKYPMGYSAYLNSVYGLSGGFSMTGGTAAAPQNALHYRSFGYDFERNQVFTTFYPNGTQYDPELLADFSFREAFGGEAFGGFTDGKVKLKITPVTMQKDSFTVFISEIAGKQISESEAFSYKVEQKPLISVDLQGYEENAIPRAVVGKAYPIFEAAGLDMNKGKVDVETKVFYGYTNLHKARVNIVDGTFTPTRVGEYTIEYVATSSLGVTTTKLVHVNAVNKTSELTLALENEKDYTQNANVGEEIKLFSAYTISNNVGHTALRVWATLKSNTDTMYEINEETDYSFQPYYAGEYEIVYEYKDFIETKKKVATLVVEKDEFIYFETIGGLPNVFIKNGTYNVNVIKAYSCESGAPLEVPVKVYVQNDNDATQTLIENGCKITANAQVKLVYKPDVAFEVMPKEIVRPVVDVGMTTEILSMQKYFVATQGEMAFTATDNGIDGAIVAVDSNDTVAFTFANALQKQSFEMMMKPLVTEGVDYVAFDALNVYLSDFDNAEKYVKISLCNLGDRWEVVVNDGASAQLATTWGSDIDEFSIVYYPSGGTLAINGGKVNLKLENFYGTSERVSFTKAINLGFEIEGANGCQGVTIQNINGQKLSNGKRELGKPVVDLSGNVTAGAIKYGEVITTLPIMCYDVLSPTVNAKLKIIAPSGAVVEDINGNRLTGVDPLKSYQFKLEEYGTYTLVVQALDINKTANSTSKQLAIEVENKVLPEITITNVTTTARARKAFALASFSVDNKAKDEYSSYYVIRTPESVRELVKDGSLYTPDGKVTEIGTNYTPALKGTYTVTIMVIDKAGNMGETTYTVEVK